MNKDQDIEKLFQDSFSNFEVTPPVDLKLKIDRQLKFNGGFSAIKIKFFGVLIAGFIGILTFVVSNVFQVSKSDEVSYSMLKNSEIQNDSKNINTEKKSTTSFSKDVNKGVKSNINFNNTKIIPEEETEKSGEIKLSKTKNEISIVNKKKIRKSTIDESSTKQTNEIKESKFERNINSNLKKKNVTFDKKIKDFDRKSTNKLNKKSKGKKSKTIKIDKFTESFSDEKESEFLSNLSSQKVDEQLKNEDFNSLKKEKDITLSSANSNPTESTKIDSLDSKSNKTIDKTIDESKDETKVLKKKFPLLLSLKFGSSAPINKLSNSSENRIEESSLFQLQAEVSYELKSSFGISSGFNFYQHKELYTVSKSMTESVVTGNTVDYIIEDSISYHLDSNGIVIDSVVYHVIADSTLTQQFKDVTISSQNSSSYLVRSFSLPILFSYSQKLSNKVYLDLMAGGILSLQTLKFLDTNNPLNSALVINKFGFKSCLKTHLRYQFTQFGVSLSSNFSYDFGAAKIQNLKRNRMLFDFGIGLHYQF